MNGAETNAERPITRDPLPDLEKTPAFRQVLADVSEVFSYWYHVEPDELPCLSSNSIRFLTDEEFQKQEDESYRRRNQENLLVITLIRLGVEGGDLRPFQGQAFLINPFDPTRNIYGRGNTDS